MDNQTKPAPPSLQAYLADLHSRFSRLKEGAVADYIPELTRADPDWFGIAIVTVDGHVYQVGDTRQPFTIQSISKAFTYGIALEDQGLEQVRAKIDVEPSGEPFNSISLEPETGRPRNPMINAGAIVATGLVDDSGPGGRMARILDIFGRFAARGLEVDEAVYASEKRTGHRNRAISHMLRNFEILDGDPEPVLDTYFRQCSILVTARDLALMGASLANNGVNPITGVRALPESHVPRVLSLMATCGMYDYSGNWTYSVGMPAKSGVGGGIVAILPGQFGLAVFSPRLDSKGNSVRGIAVCEALSSHFGSHMLRTTRITRATVIRTRYTLNDVRSKLYRPPEHAALLDRVGHTVEVLELHGELVFASAEIVAAHVDEILPERDRVVLDLRRVMTVDEAAIQMLAALADRLVAQGKGLLLTGFGSLYGFERMLKQRLEAVVAGEVLAPEGLDAALEWCEDRLLLEAEPGYLALAGTASLSQQLICRDFTTAELDFLQAHLMREERPAGTVICREGEPADSVYLLERGRVSTWIRVSGRERYRLFASSPGWPFGESALFGGNTRSADVLADTDVILQRLEPASLEAGDGPVAVSTRLKLFQNLARMNLHRLRKANGEIRALSY